MVVSKKDIVLRRGAQSKIVKKSQQLCTMICAVVDDMDQDLPHHQVPILSFERCIEEHIVAQPSQVITHRLFNTVPVRTDADSIRKVCRIEGCWNVGALQSTESGLIDAYQMHNLISHRSKRVVRWVG